MLNNKQHDRSCKNLGISPRPPNETQPYRCRYRKLTVFAVVPDESQFLLRGCCISLMRAEPILGQKDLIKRSHPGACESEICPAINGCLQCH
jgi:hypothetical protein